MSDDLKTDIAKRLASEITDLRALEGLDRAIAEEKLAKKLDNQTHAEEIDRIKRLVTEAS